jgi:UDP-N-acetylglucosamine acyltransferase
MTNKIHSSAIIEDSVRLGDNITIGPYCYISGNVEIADGNQLLSHIVIKGNTLIGKNNKFYPFTNIGEIPQDLKFKNELSQTIIGDNNQIRENVTIHSGTELGNSYHNITNITRIGNNNLLMVGSHVAHDCVIGNNNILANNATLAGHVSIANKVIIGGLSAVQQFVRIGDYAIIGGMSGIDNDVVPYAMVIGQRANIAGVNIVGLKRNNFTKEEIKIIKDAYTEIFENKDINFMDKVKILDQKYSNKTIIRKLIEFIETSNNKALLKPKNYNQ